MSSLGRTRARPTVHVMRADREATATRLRHDALVYSSDEEFVRRAASFVGDGLDEGAAAVAVTSRGSWGALREELGARAADVQFADRDEFYVRPAKAIAAYDAMLRHHLARGAPDVRVIAEVQCGPTQPECKAWTAYEAIANVAFAQRPSWIVCAYDTRTLPASVVEGASRTHSHVMGEDRMPSEGYGDPKELVRSLQPEYEPLPALRPLGPLTGAGAFRDGLAAAMSAAGTPVPRVLDMIVAANEVFANAVQHGGGVTAVRAGTVDGHFVCEVSDGGPGHDDPFAGYLPPERERVGGRGSGLWVARQLASRVDLFSTGRGLTVRLWL
jgi:anti-sigma regulatory factor (Ser/Thr protein kinase)